MDPTTYVKRKAASDVAAPRSQHIFLLGRNLRAKEKEIINKQFPVVLVYDAGLNSSEMDLSKMAFDALIIDIRIEANHFFLEVLKDQADKLGVPRTLLKQRFTNAKAVAAAYGANVIGDLSDHDGPNFFLTLLKKSLPRLESRLLTLAKKLFALLSK